MRIGFTGTRRGMSKAQKEALEELLASHSATEFHHGDGIGADAEAHGIAHALGCRIVIHPPSIELQRAWKCGSETRPPKRYLDRNRDIVRETQLLIAAPGVAIEELRSGTWSTVRYARRIGRPVQIIGPDGTVT